MQIACPSCDERYRIEPARLPARRVRTACLACGKTLFLRVTNGAAAAAAAPAQRAAPDEEVPLWTEPPRPATPAAEPEVPAEMARQDSAVAPPVRPGERPLAPNHEPAAAAPAAAEPEAAAPEPPEADVTEAAVLAAAAGPLTPTVEPLPDLSSPVRPLAPYLEGAEGEERREVPPVEAEPWSAPPEPGAPATAQPTQGFSFAQVGDASARAQRLARALVSDILVYHPKKVEDAARDGNLKGLMREEVEKSWDEYCERLGPEVARANRQHFVAALNEILARGNPVF